MRTKFELPGNEVVVVDLTKMSPSEVQDHVVAAEVLLKELQTFILHAACFEGVEVYPDANGNF